MPPPCRQVALPAGRQVWLPATARRGLKTPTYILDCADREGRNPMREVLVVAAQTIGYVVVTAAAVWLVFQYVPAP